MKSEERHKLKTNELAESLSKLPSYLAMHGKNLFMGLLILIAVIVGGAMWWRLHQTEQERLGLMLVNLTVEDTQNRQMAAMRSRDEKAVGSYIITPVIEGLSELVKQSDGSPISMNAMLQEAETKHSELLFSNQLMTDEQKNEIYKRMESLYQRVLNEYPNNVMGQGGARMGLGLLAEDQQDFEKAKSLYQQIASEADTRFAGTQFPLQAEKRLKLLNDINKPIEFAMAAPEAAEPVSGPALPPEAPPAANELKPDVSVEKSPLPVKENPAPAAAEEKK
jgi:hypothetical protein